MNKLVTGFVTALAILGATPAAQAATSDDACAALMEARGHLVGMLGSTDKAVLDDLKGKVHAASAKLDGILGDMQKGYNAAASQAKDFKTVWEAFKNTRETEIIPALYAGRVADAKAVAGGVQAERMKQMKTAMACK